MSFETVLSDYVTKEIVRGREGHVTADADLLASGLLDSLGILQLVAFIEERFKLRVPDEDVVYENFHSIAALSAYLAAMQSNVVR